MNARLISLRARHGALDREVRSEAARLSADNLKVSALKRSKLATRDEIARLEAGLTA
ncbi:MAG: DUF465 domain-containing protein [Phenylobacterium sp.]|nr:DUF465 domain-containing protein [Phenylobacterium sp.]